MKEYLALGGKWHGEQFVFFDLKRLAEGSEHPTTLPVRAANGNLGRLAAAFGVTVADLQRAPDIVAGKRFRSRTVQRGKEWYHLFEPRQPMWGFENPPYRPVQREALRHLAKRTPFQSLCPNAMWSRRMQYCKKGVEATQTLMVVVCPDCIETPGWYVGFTERYPCPTCSK